MRTSHTTTPFLIKLSSKKLLKDRHSILLKILHSRFDKPHGHLFVNYTASNLSINI